MDYKGLKLTVSNSAVLFLVFIAFMYFIYQCNKKQSDFKIQQLETELDGKERRKKELEEKLGHKEQSKCIYQDILLSDNLVPLHVYFTITDE